MNQPDERPMTSGQVADAFGVSVRTVRRWATAGRLPYFRTPTGHRRFPHSAVTALLPAPERTP
ncbi:helix-turn-helix domain-containing protein [Actinocorallia aurantiaca]|uniref:HTH merR-type domain-containing protein n=1 Tax=Actinocorallia aurantiaca TaxID=46204 RepID=A0ABN3UHF9_9ACTN